MKTVKGDPAGLPFPMERDRHMEITEIRKRRGRQYQLYLDGEEAVTVDAATFDESPYRVGSTLTDEALRALLQASEERRAREKALYLLSRRDHARGELEKKLRTAAGAQIAADTAARMEALGLVDDAAYAARLARDLAARKCFPRRRVIQELTAKGIDRETAEEAADAAMEELGADDRQQALALLRKKYYNRLLDDDARRKTAAALARYGFSADAVRYAMEQAADWREENMTE